MNPMYVQLGIALATILGSGVVSVIVNNRYSVRRAENEFRRKKMEELFLAFHGYSMLLASQNVVWPDVMDGSLTYEQALETNANYREEDFANFRMVEMLISLYFPMLEVKWKEFLLVRDNINSIRNNFKDEYERSGSDPSFVVPFRDAMLSLSEKKTAFKEQLAAISRSL